MAIEKLINSKYTLLLQFVCCRATVLKVKLQAKHPSYYFKENEGKKRDKLHTNTESTSQTCGINSLTGSLISFKGEPKLDGPALCFITRGEPDVLLGDKGGALPAGNIDGNELIALACGLDEFPGTFKGPPALASLSNVVTFNHRS